MKLIRFGQLYKTIDWLLIAAVLILLIFGCAVIFSLTSSGKNLVDSQIVFAVVGLVVSTILTFIDYRTWRSLGWPLYGFGLATLLAVLIFGSHIFGATRWINLGGFQFQPSELMKLIIIISLAQFFSIRQTLTLKDTLALVLLIGIPVGLISKQPDLGSASVIVVVSLVMLLCTKVHKSYFIAVLALIVVAALFGYHFLAPYQRERVKIFLSPGSDPAGSGYNIAQSKIAIGSGGIFGQGLGQGSQSQLQFLPVAHTDFIFAGAAEATGFVGSSVLLLLLAAVVLRAYFIARVSQDSFGMYLGVGLATLYLYQTFVNIGGNLGLVPVTGIPLPFVSSGGTAVITALVGVGLLESIYLRHKKIRFG